MPAPWCYKTSNPRLGLRTQSGAQSGPNRNRHRHTLMSLGLIAAARHAWHTLIALFVTTLTAAADGPVPGRTPSNLSHSLPRLEVQFPHSTSISALAVSSDGRIAASADVNGWITLRSMSTGRQFRKVYSRFSVLQLAFTDDGTHLLSLGGYFQQETLEAKIWDIQQGTLIHSFATTLPGLRFKSHRFAEFVHGRSGEASTIICGSSHDVAERRVLAITCERRRIVDLQSREEQATTEYRQFRVPPTSR